MTVQDAEVELATVQQNLIEVPCDVRFVCHNGRRVFANPEDGRPYFMLLSEGTVYAKSFDLVDSLALLCVVADALDALLEAVKNKLKVGNNLSPEQLAEMPPEVLCTIFQGGQA